jgi:hypothetical protein
MAGTQVHPAGTDKSMARSDVPPETDESAIRAGKHPEPKGPTARTKLSLAGLLRSVRRGPGVFVAGFRGVTWDNKADKQIKDDLRAFGGMRSLSDVDKQRLKPRIKPLLQSQREFLRSEAAVRAIANRVTWVLCIGAVAVPAVVVGLIAPRGDVGGAVFLYFVELLGLAIAATWPTAVLRTLTGRYRATLIWLAFVLWVSVASAVLIVIAPGTSEPDGTIFVAAVCAATVFTIVLLARAYVVAWNQNALINAWAEQRPEAAVVWMLLGVIWVLAEEPRRGRHPTPRVVQVLVEEPDGDGAPTPLQRSGTARAILAKAAAAVNDYLPRLIDGGRPYSANAQAIANETAAFLLDLRSAVNLPGGRARKEDLAQLTKTVEDWSIGSLANLPRQASPAADSQESSSRRPGLLQVVRNVVVGTLPLILLIAATLLPLKMSAPVTQALAPFAVTWLLLSVASIFAPADVKKNFIKNLPSR